MKPSTSKQILDNAKRNRLRMTDASTGRAFDPDAKASKRDVLGCYRSKTELLYAQHLNTLLRAGEIADWTYESHRCDLTDGTVHSTSTKLPKGHSRYTPDFWVLTDDGAVEFHECKGFWRTADRQRWRLAASQHPEYVWRAIRFIRGRWVVETFGDVDRAVVAGNAVLKMIEEMIFNKP